MNAAVFLDRDNTLIHNDGDLGDPDKVRLIKGAASAVASLQGLGYKVVVVTNQGGVARGKYSEEDVDAVHRRVNELIQANSGAFIDRFYYCPYHPEGSERRYRRDHPWRKPKPGMLIQAGKHLALTMGQSWMVGDQLRDIQAGYAAGVTPILIDPTGEIATKIDSMPPALNGDDADVDPVIIEPNRDYFVARNLIEAARIIGQKRRPPSSVKVAPERKPSRVVVEAERAPQAESAEPRKVVKKKILRRRKKAATDADKTGNTADVATLEPAGDAASKAKINTSNETANQKKSVSGARGEAPGNLAKPSRSASTGHADDDIDIDATFDDDADHAPTLTMPSLSPNVILDDEDENDGSADVTATPNGRAERPSEVATDRLAAHPAIKTPPAPTPASTPPVPSRDENQARSAPRSRDESERSRTKQAEPAPKHAPSTSASESNAQSSANNASDHLSTPPDNENVDQTLRQILQELRNQRLNGSEFSYIGVMAIVLQVVAIVCLLAALLMGSGNDQIFSRWIACAVVLQLGTIAMLLFKK